MWQRSMIVGVMKEDSIMSHDDDEAAYFRRRSEEERERAVQAAGTPIRRLHLDLAERYSERVREVMARGALT